MRVLLATLHMEAESRRKGDTTATGNAANEVLSLGPSRGKKASAYCRLVVPICRVRMSEGSTNTRVVTIPQ